MSLSRSALKITSDRDHWSNLVLFRPDLPSAYHVPRLSRQHHRLSKQRFNRNCKSTCVASAAQAHEADLPTESPVTGLVTALAHERDSLRCHQLSAASSLSIYRLNMLCKTPYQEAVLAALAEV